jgi:hypothetical protein
MPYLVNGESATISEPQLKDGTMWVPLREVGEALGGNLDWDADNRVAILYSGVNIATLKIGDNTADINGEKRELQEAPYLENGETWVPVRFFNLLGYSLNVDPQNKSVEFSAPV